MSIKLDKLRSDVDEMLTNMQLDTIRQFQIQRGTIKNLLDKYMIDEESVLQEQPLGNKYFEDQREEIDAESDGSGPDYIYL